MTEILTPTLIRAVRALLHMDQAGLAESSGITRKTISLIEANDEPPGDPRRIKMLQTLKLHLEQEWGAEFTFETKQTGEGVRLKQPFKSKTPKSKQKPRA